ncbi:MULTISPECIES: serine/threonine-protein kinase [unclassified Microcoleus]|uniref:serine/threonine-protein kinase n=1 Tax=unclassified Microcoleus TaxID=2642155 RepID=UPI002FD5AE1E
MNHLIRSIGSYEIIEEIQSGVNTAIYRAAIAGTNKGAIVKLLKAEYPTLEEITRFKHEYQILQHLDALEGIVKPYSLETYKNGLALILEDFGGESLKNYMVSKKNELSDFLTIAIQIASALAEVHKKHVIHKDIKPQNILINPKTGEVKLADFSIATRLERENAAASHPHFLEGTLAYMSPEQTGRMNRSIDYRTDLYSLGVTLYEILTGVLPCTNSEPLELVYCHIAQKIVPPQALNPEIPPAISDIVMKLLAKNAEDRYQSAEGLKFD